MRLQQNHPQHHRQRQVCSLFWQLLMLSDALLRAIDGAIGDLPCVCIYIGDVAGLVRRLVIHLALTFATTLLAGQKHLCRSARECILNRQSIGAQDAHGTQIYFVLHS